MKPIKLSLIITLSACLLTPVLSNADTKLDAYEAAVKNAITTLDNAKAYNYEWRDSRRMLKEADKLYKAGNHDQAMKLVATAQRQGTLAIAQAKQQSSVTGPHK
jgi:hypothetical protein